MVPAVGHTFKGNVFGVRGICISGCILRDYARECANEFGAIGTRGKVFRFKKLVAFVGVELAGHDFGRAELAPFHVTMRGGAHGVAHHRRGTILVERPRARELAARSVAANCGCLAQIRDEAFAFETGAPRQSAQFDERRINIQRLYKCIGEHTARAFIGRGYYKRRARVIVINFADALDTIAIALKMLVKRNNTGQGFSRIGEQIPNADRVGTASGEHGLARWIADGLQHIGMGETRAVRGERVYIRCYGGRVAKASDVQPQIIDRDVENIGPRQGGRCNGQIPGLAYRSGGCKERDGGESAYFHNIKNPASVSPSKTFVNLFEPCDIIYHKTIMDGCI